MTSCWSPAMTLDIGSQRMVIAMEIVSHKMGSYLFGQVTKANDESINFKMIDEIWHTHTHTHT